MAKAECPDCPGTVEFNFALALEGEYKVCSFGTCKNCINAGDTRSIHAKAKVTPNAWVKAVNSGLPVVQFGKRRSP